MDSISLQFPTIARPMNLSHAYSRSHSGLIPAVLIALLALPLILGSIRLAELSSGALIISDRLPLAFEIIPIAVHIISTICFCVLGAVQFVPALRAVNSGWHRISGKLVVLAGLMVPLSGIWLTLFANLPEEDSDALNVIRMLVSIIMLYAIVTGIKSIRNRRYSDHRVWMIRAYAIAAGTGVQVFTSVFFIAISGELNSTTKTLAMAAGWVLSILAAEWWLKKSGQSQPLTLLNT